MISAHPSAVWSEIAATAAVTTMHLDGRARLASAIELSRQVGDRMAVPVSEAFDVLTTVPENMLGLLDSPQGWSALAEMIAADFQRPPITYTPTLH